jgi:hypothetical protein
MRDRDRSGRYVRPDNPMEWVAILALLLIGVGLVAAPAWVGLSRADTAPAPAVTVPTLGSIPPCDDDAPGRPITGPCWLVDDDMTAVWPYPYAPTPLAVLRDSQ